MDKFAWEQNNNKTLVFTETFSSLITWEIYLIIELYKMKKNLNCSLIKSNFIEQDSQFKIKKFLQSWILCNFFLISSLQS